MRSKSVGMSSISVHPRAASWSRPGAAGQSGVGGNKNAVRRSDPAFGQALEVAPPSGLRLRFLLLWIAFIGAVCWVYPRATSAWRLYGLASEVADYGLCTAGPAGPSLLRDNPAEFRRLLRRRLTAARPSDRPFEACAEHARRILGSDEAEAAHRATAWSFVEYGGAAADRAAKGSVAELSLDSLGVTTRPLAELARAAWPFVRQGYTRLVKASLSAHEAPHPMELPRPGVGTGLPAWRARYTSAREVGTNWVLAVGSGANLGVYRSADHGLNWRSASLRTTGVSQFAERCIAPGSEHAFTFALGPQDRIDAVSNDSSGGAQATPLAASGADVFAVGCDDTALVAAVAHDEHRTVSLHVCRFAGICTPMPMPSAEGVGSLLRFPFDVARVRGTTIVAQPMHGVVRVTSTRDDGRTWAPLAVAYDDAEYPDLRIPVRVPTRLLSLGDRVMLYGGAQEPRHAYSVLVSDDAGASWRAP
jgi:hypothetical protein